MKFRIVVEVQDDGESQETLEQELKDAIETSCDYYYLGAKVLDIVRVQEHKDELRLREIMGPQS